MTRLVLLLLLAAPVVAPQAAILHALGFVVLTAAVLVACWWTDKNINANRARREAAEREQQRATWDRLQGAIRQAAQGSSRTAVTTAAPAKAATPTGAEAVQPAIGYRQRGVHWVRDEQGQALLEMALVMPILMFFLLACLDCAICMQDLQSLSFASQQAAICGAQASCDPASFAATLASGTGFIDGSKLVSQVTYPAAGQCTVQLTYPFQPMGIWFTAMTMQRVATAVKS